MSDLLTLKSPFQKEMFIKARFTRWKGGRVVNVARQQVHTVTATQVVKITGSTHQLRFQTVEKKKVLCSEADLPIPAKMQNDLKAGKI